MKTDKPNEKCSIIKLCPDYTHFYKHMDVSIKAFAKHNLYSIFLIVFKQASTRTMLIMVQKLEEEMGIEKML